MHGRINQPTLHRSAHQDSHFTAEESRGLVITDFPDVHNQLGWIRYLLQHAKRY
jgi:hypothetical protein